MENPEQPPAPTKKLEPMKGYLVEFVLVFAAIVLGFFAENLREYYSDRQKEKEFAQLLLEDLRTDSLNLAKAMENLNHHISAHDTILSTLKADSYDQKNLLILIRQAGFYGVILSANTTIEQLKGSGSSLYFRDKRFVSSLLKYYQIMENVEDRTRWLYIFTYDRLEPFEVKHVNRMSLTFMSQDSIRRGGLPMDNTFKAAEQFKSLYITLNSQERVELYNLIWSIRLRMTLLQKQVLPIAYKEVNTLIRQIKREFNF